MKWIVLFALAFGATLLVRAYPTSADGGRQQLLSSTDVSSKGRSDAVGVEREMVVSLVVSPDCAACNDPALVAAYNALREAIVGSSEMKVQFVGIALARSASDGLRFLERFDSLDEVVSGRGWNGTVGRSYLKREGAGVAAVPQLFVSEIVSEYDAVVGRTRFSERIVQRRIGLDAIVHLGRTCERASCVQW